MIFSDRIGSLSSAISDGVPSLAVAALVGAIALSLSVSLSRLLSAVVKGGAAAPFRSHRIALLGPPKSGKTTSLIAALDYIRKVPQPGVIRIRGQNTIKRLEVGTVELGRGGYPSRTDEDSSDVFRFDYKAKLTTLGQLFHSIYGIPFLFRVEIADFAGEHTERFFADEYSWTSSDIPDAFSLDAGQNFLKWISESDMCVFYIDSEKLGQNVDLFVGEITAKYMALWERYLDIHSDIFSSEKGTPVSIVFSKLDILVDAGVFPDEDEAVLGCQALFSELISYMKSSSRRVEVFGISIPRRAPIGGYFGIPKLSLTFLPKPFVRL